MDQAYQEKKETEKFEPLEKHSDILQRWLEPFFDAIHIFTGDHGTHHEKHYFESYDPIGGLKVINLQPGMSISKKQVAKEFGYSGNRVWEKHSDILQRWLEPFFDVSHHNLIRKPFRGIRLLTFANKDDFKSVLEIINDAAQAYKGVIPPDCWHHPYMPETELRQAIAHGVEFWGIEHEGQLAGVMGLQRVKDVALIRHAYVRTACRNMGLGGRLLRYLPSLIQLPCLVGTWAAATWAVTFYENHGFRLVTPQQEKDDLLTKYWKVPPRQIETSVVLADERWFSARGG